MPPKRGVIFFSILWVLYASLLFASRPWWPGRALISPLAQTNELTTASDLTFSFIRKNTKWLLGSQVLAATTARPPDVSAKSVLILDVESGKVLYEKEASQRRPAASLVKIMTAIVAFERGFLENTMVVSQKAAEQPSHVMGLSPGEVVPLKDLLYGLFLVSGNDAAMAIGEGLAGSETRFVSWMNAKAENLGLQDTKFVNPSGLDEDSEQQYTTAHDLAVMTRYALGEFKDFGEMIKTRTYVSDYDPGKHKVYAFDNETPLLGRVDGVIGVKDGYTPEAGLCLISLAERNGKKVLVVILDAETRRQDAESLLDYGFQVLQ